VDTVAQVQLISMSCDIVSGGRLGHLYFV